MGGNKPLVSVIIPVYNVAPFLEECIQSVLHQTYDNLEIILIDDGSNDQSGKICDEYAADDRINVIHKNNAGVSATRNTGIEASHGDYLCFVDGDDFVIPEYVEYLYALICSGEHDVALTTQMFGNFNEQQVEKHFIQNWSGEAAVEAILCYRVPIGCYNKLFKKEALKNVRFIDDIFIGEGFNFNVAAFQNATSVIAGNCKIYYYRRDNANSAMSKFSIQKCECGLKALEIIKQNLAFHSLRIKNAWKFENWRTHSDFFDMMVLANAKNQYPEMYQRCKKVTREYALSALKVPTSRQNKLRALTMWIDPNLVPLAMRIRQSTIKRRCYQADCK